MSIGCKTCNFIKARLFFHVSSRSFQKKKKKERGGIKELPCSGFATVLFSQYCRGTLIVFIATRRLDSETLNGNLMISHTHLTNQIEIWHLIKFDEKMLANVWCDVRKAPFSNNKFINFLMKWSPVSAVKCSWALIDSVRYSVATLKQKGS